MEAHASRFVRSSVALVALAALAGLGACDDQEAVPSGPEGQQPSFYHGDGLQDDETADDIKVVDDNISGDGSEVCNSSTVKDGNLVGDEGTWSGQKVDPAEGIDGNGFTFEVRQGGKSLTWSDDGVNLMQAVVIKAGGSTVIYYYNEGDAGTEPDPVEDFEDEGLDGDDKEISHYTYCFVPQPAVVRGLKFEDADGNGDQGDTESALSGWEIRIFADDGDGVLSGSEIEAGAVATTTTADGNGRLDEGQYEFFLDPGDYVVCEEDRAGWNQSEPSNTSDACAAGDGLAEDGHALSLAAGEISEGNDFGNNQTTIEVRVLSESGGETTTSFSSSSGVPVEGRQVVAVHSTKGAYNGGVLRAAVTDAEGLAVISAEPGSYCVRTTPLVTPDGNIVPPANFEDPPTFSDDLGTAVSLSDGDEGITSAQLTLENFKEGCLVNPVVSPGDEVTLTLNPPAGDINGEFETESLDELSAWLVLDIGSLLDAGVRSSWVENLPDGLENEVVAGTALIGLPHAADEDDPDGSQAFSIETPGGDAVLESDIVPVGGGFVAASAGVSGSGSVDRISAELNFCVVNTTLESEEDGDKFRYFDPYDHGFLADAGQNLVPTVYGSVIEHTGGSSSYKLRAVKGNKKSYNLDYDCSGGSCERTKLSGGLGNQVDVTILSSRVGPDRYRVRIITSGLPEGLEAVQTAFSASTDNVPDASRDEDNDGFVEDSPPSQCKTGGSRWVLGG